MKLKENMFDVFTVNVNIWSVNICLQELHRATLSEHFHRPLVSDYSRGQEGLGDRNVSTF